MLDALGEKVAEVHRCCVDDRITNLSTLEKLASIENRMSLLLQGLESIPEENLEMMRKIKDSERRSRYVSLPVHHLLSLDCKKILIQQQIQVSSKGIKNFFPNIKYTCLKKIMLQTTGRKVKRADRETEGKDEEILGEIHG